MFGEGGQNSKGILMKSEGDLEKWRVCSTFEMENQRGRAEKANKSLTLWVWWERIIFLGNIRCI